MHTGTHQHTHVPHTEDLKWAIKGGYRVWVCARGRAHTVYLGAPVCVSVLTSEGYFFWDGLGFQFVELPSTS